MQTSHASFLPAIEALCPQPGSSGAFIAEVFGAEKPCLNGAADFPTALAGVLAKWEIEHPVSEVLALWNRINPDPAMMQTVADLRKQGIRVCLATNQQAHRAGIMAKGLGYATCFDELFFSYALGVAKPEPGYFRKILNLLGVSPARVLFIDDHLKNAAAAESVGIAAEVYHVDQGPGHFAAILQRYGLYSD